MPFLFNRLNTNYMKKISLFLILLAVTLSVSAKDRTLEQLMLAARQTLQNHAESGQQRRAIANASLDVIQRCTQLTVIGGKVGFAVIANDDEFEAVLGYSTNEYDVENVAPGYLWWLETINKQLEYNKERGLKMETVRPEGPLFPSSVEFLMETQWGQGTPYNNMTPTYQDGKKEVHYVTGCVATAMAQIMYYYKHPEKGKGTISYYFTPEGSQVSTKLSDNLAKTPYAWDKMLPIYKGVNYTPEQGDAVALLMKHCGYSVNMQYTKSGSGAFTSDAVDALRKRFYYNKNMHFYWRSYFPNREWMEKIFAELNDGCPVLYGAQRSDGGHEFVFDGYDEDGKVHVNWGWEGSQDGWFDIASLNGYTSGQEMVLVRKNDVLLPYQSYWGMDGDLVIKNPTVTALNASFVAYNLDYNAFSGKIGLLAMNLDTKEITELDAQNVEKEYMYGGYMSFSAVDITRLPQGTYRVFVGSFCNGQDIEWQPIRAHEQYNNSYILTISDNIKLEKENNANWTDIDEVRITSDVNAPVRYFDLQGREVDASHRGLVIMRQGNTVKKVIR